MTHKLTIGVVFPWAGYQVSVTASFIHGDPKASFGIGTLFCGKILTLFNLAPVVLLTIN